LPLLPVGSGFGGSGFFFKTSFPYTTLSHMRIQWRSVRFVDWSHQKHVFVIVSHQQSVSQPHVISDWMTRKIKAMSLIDYIWSIGKTIFYFTCSPILWQIWTPSSFSAAQFIFG
jgi:hypothetical protein